MPPGHHFEDTALPPDLGRILITTELLPKTTRLSAAALCLEHAAMLAGGLQLGCIPPKAYSLFEASAAHPANNQEH
jgi:hypothetical protein